MVRTMGGLLIGLALVLCAGMDGAAAAPPDNPYRQFQLKELKTVAVKHEKHTLTAWIADTPAKRAEGMMFLDEQDVKPNEAMLFVFTRAQRLSFWMKNTYIPLDIAYLNKEKKVLNVLTMRAFDVTSDYASDGEAIYALEAKAGAFKRLGIKAGVKLSFPDSVKAKE